MAINKWWLNQRIIVGQVQPLIVVCLRIHLLLTYLVRLVGSHKLTGHRGWHTLKIALSLQLFNEILRKGYLVGMMALLLIWNVLHRRYYAINLKGGQTKGSVPFDSIAS